MSRAAILALLVLLGGCSPRPTFEQVQTVTKACHEAGMDSRVRDDTILCWVRR